MSARKERNAVGSFAERRNYVLLTTNECKEYPLCSREINFSVFTFPFSVFRFHLSVFSLSTDALALSVAAALSYRSEDDSQSMQIANVIAADGLSATVRQLTGIEDEAFVEKVGDFYNKIITFAG